MNAQDRGWGAPGLSSEQMVRLDVDGIPCRVRAEVAPLFTELVRWLKAERARNGVDPLVSAGGYNKRFISGTGTWSNHAWGLAVDFNPGTNPYSRKGTTDMPPGTSAKAKSLGMRWGGDYKGKRDAMHFEFMGTPEDAVLLTAALRAGQVKKRPARPQAPSEETLTYVWNTVAKTVHEVDRRTMTYRRVDANVLDWAPTAIVKKVTTDNWMKELTAR